MVKKIMIVLLSIVTVVLVADLVYIGTMLFASPEQPAVPAVSDSGNSVTVMPPAWSQPTQNAYANPVTTAPYVQQTQPVQTQPLVPADTPTATQNPYGTSTSATTETVPTTLSAAPQQGGYTKEQIIAAMESAVAYLKNAQNFTGVKTQIPTISLTQLSVPSLQDAAQSIINRFADTKTTTYVFTNGYAVDPETNETVTPMQAIPPDSAQFRIAPEAVTGYNVTTDAAGNTVYAVAIMQESCTLASPVPYYHSMCMDYIDLNEYDISPAQFTSGDITYHEASIFVTVNSAGVPIALRQYMPVTGVGEGSLLFLTATGSLTGSLDEQWTFTW